MPRITKEPEERKQEILNTAIRLFYENGYEKTSMADIAKAMNVAQGLCYRYFSSKEALFDTAIDQYAQRQVDDMTKILATPGLSLIQLVEQMPTFLEAEAENSDIQKVCHGPESLKIHNQLSISICAKMAPIIQKQLELANERGEIKIKDPRAAASFCVYGQLGILLDHTLSGEERVGCIKSFLTEMLQKFC